MDKEYYLFRIIYNIDDNSNKFIEIYKSKSEFNLSLSNLNLPSDTTLHSIDDTCKNNNYGNSCLSIKSEETSINEITDYQTTNIDKSMLFNVFISIITCQNKNVVYGILISKIDQTKDTRVTYISKSGIPTSNSKISLSHRFDVSTLKLSSIFSTIGPYHKIDTLLDEYENLPNNNKPNLQYLQNFHDKTIQDNENNIKNIEKEINTAQGVEISRGNDIIEKLQDIAKNLRLHVISKKNDILRNNTNDNINNLNQNNKSKSTTLLGYIKKKLFTKNKVPNSEEPNTEEPNSEEPNSEEPNSEEPSTEVPNTEAPNSEEPNTEEPNSEEPNTEDSFEIINFEGIDSEKIKFEGSNFYYEETQDSGKTNSEKASNKIITFSRDTLIKSLSNYNDVVKKDYNKNNTPFTSDPFNNIPFDKIIDVAKKSLLYVDSNTVQNNILEIVTIVSRNAIINSLGDNKIINDDKINNNINIRNNINNIDFAKMIDFSRKQLEYIGNEDFHNDLDNLIIITARNSLLMSIKPQKDINELNKNAEIYNKNIDFYKNIDFPKMINKARQYLTFLNENEDDDSTTEYTETNIKDYVERTLLELINAE